MAASSRFGICGLRHEVLQGSFLLMKVNKSIQFGKEEQQNQNANVGDSDLKSI
jgi:hypothetical protein